VRAGLPSTPSVASRAAKPLALDGDETIHAFGCWGGFVTRPGCRAASTSFDFPIEAMTNFRPLLPMACRWTIDRYGISTGHRSLCHPERHLSENASACF